MVGVQHILTRSHSVIERGNSDGEGRDCIYYKLDDNWGVKTYNSLDMRNRCYKMQLIAYKGNCGPAVGIPFEVQNSDGENIYCYITEHIADAFDEDVNIRKTNGWDELNHRLTDAGIYNNDWYSCNYGRRTNGDMLVIDFGCVYFRNESGF